MAKKVIIERMRPLHRGYVNVDGISLHINYSEGEFVLATENGKWITGFL